MSSRITVALVISLAASACVEAQQIPGDGEQPTGPDPSSPRVLEGLQVLYTFEEGSGLDVKDHSGVEPAFDLHLDNLVTNKWVADGGIEIVGPSVITSLDVAEKVFVACVGANAVTIEAWIEPANNTQTGTVFAYSKQNQRNASLTVDNTRYAGSVLTSKPDPMLPGEIIETIETVQTPENMAAPQVQHVVYTRDASGAALYLDGIDTKPPATTTPTTPTEPQPLADQNEWSPAYQLVLGNQSTGGSPWLGKVYMAAVYCKRLSTAEVQKNYGAGY